MSVNIQLEWTPNPSTLKYVVDRTLMTKGAMNFTSKEGVRRARRWPRSSCPLKASPA